MSLIEELAAWKYFLSSNDSKEGDTKKGSYRPPKYYIGKEAVSKFEFEHALRGKTIEQYNYDNNYTIEKYCGKKKYYEIKLKIDKAGLYDVTNFELLRDIYLDEHFVILPDSLDLAYLIIDGYTDYEYRNNIIVKEWHEKNFPYFVDYSTKEAFERKIKNREKFLDFEYSDKWYYENVKKIVYEYIYKNNVENISKEQILKYINDLNNSKNNKYCKFAIKAEKDLKEKNEEILCIGK